MSAQLACHTLEEAKSKVLDKLKMDITYCETECKNKVDRIESNIVKLNKLTGVNKL